MVLAPVKISSNCSPSRVSSSSRALAISSSLSEFSLSMEAVLSYCSSSILRTYWFILDARSSEKFCLEVKSLPRKTSSASL